MLEEVDTVLMTNFRNLEGTSVKTTFWGFILAGTIQTFCFATNSITNIQFNPPSPASLDWNEVVSITYSYETDEAAGVYVSCTRRHPVSPHQLF